MVSGGNRHFERHVKTVYLPFIRLVHHFPVTSDDLRIDDAHPARRYSCVSHVVEYGSQVSVVRKCR